MNILRRRAQSCKPQRPKGTRRRPKATGNWPAWTDEGRYELGPVKPTADDARWWANESNQGADVYEPVPAAPRSSGVSLSVNEEAAMRFNLVLGLEAEAEREANWAEYDQWSAKVSRWVDHDQPGPQPY